MPTHQHQLPGLLLVCAVLMPAGGQTTPPPPLPALPPGAPVLVAPPPEITLEDPHRALDGSLAETRLRALAAQLTAAVLPNTPAEPPPGAPRLRAILIADRPKQAPGDGPWRAKTTLLLTLESPTGFRTRSGPLEAWGASWDGPAAAAAQALDRLAADYAPAAALDLWGAAADYAARAPEATAPRDTTLVVEHPERLTPADLRDLELLFGAPRQEGETLRFTLPDATTPADVRRQFLEPRGLWEWGAVEAEGTVVLKQDNGTKETTGTKAIEADE
ncbi:MAG: hypothetical protein PWP23_1712 [Candidatus Sumerlaeota bacterium]|nr:hypothetical protein [Candidatus Sumerlaeota bacterium]